MGNVWWLATEATEVSHGGFGLNFDLLETNLINLVIIIGVLVYFGRGVIGNILTTRRSEIETAIREAEQRQKEAAAALADQQQKLAQAQAEAEKIKAQAETNAQAAKAAILAQLDVDLQRLRESATQDLNVEREKAIAELRQRAVNLALQRAESKIQDQLNENLQQQLIDRSIALLGGKS